MVRRVSVVRIDQQQAEQQTLMTLDPSIPNCHELVPEQQNSNNLSVDKIIGVDCI